MTKETGETIAWADYDAWGKPLSPRGHDMNMAGMDNAVGFTSYTYDTVLDLYFAQARFYDQNDRRFTQVDPIKDGINWYAYCEGNPVVFVDPSGLDSWIIVSLYENDEAENQRNINQAEIRKAAYEEQYGTPCRIRYVNTADDFRTAWNSLGRVYSNSHSFRDVPIDAVEVISHGHVSMAEGSNSYLNWYIYFSDGSKLYSSSYEEMRSEDRSIDDLNPKTMTQLYFSACNTANQDFKTNIVQAFYDKNPNISSVAGWDGGVAFVFSSRNPFTRTKIDYPSKRQPTFDTLSNMFDTKRKAGKITLTRP